MGGLARRASMMAKIRQDQEVSSSTLFIAGAYEFLADDQLDAPVAKAWPALAKAFAGFAYNAGALSPEEAKALEAQGLKMPSSWVVLDHKKVQSTILSVPGGKVGLLFLPVLAKPEAGVDVETIRLIEREAKKLRPQVNLVVGVSPWGAPNETAYMDVAEPVLDVLLGSGPGVGFSAKPASGGKVLWMRTYTKGKALYSLELPAWPAKRDFKWEMGTNYTSQAILLNEAFAPDPAMEALFNGIPDANDQHENKGQ